MEFESASNIMLSSFMIPVITIIASVATASRVVFAQARKPLLLVQGLRALRAGGDVVFMTTILTSDVKLVATPSRPAPRLVPIVQQDVIFADVDDGGTVLTNVLTQDSIMRHGGQTQW